eukprot:scaffold81106_cov31-Tisochrysis_lutea.AAC.4
MAGHKTLPLFTPPCYGEGTTHPPAMPHGSWHVGLDRIAHCRLRLRPKASPSPIGTPGLGTSTR